MSSQDAAISIALRLVDQATAPMNQAMAMVERSTAAVEQRIRMLGKATEFVAGAFAALGVGWSIGALVSQVQNAITAVDDLKVSTIQIAAQITTMQGPENVAEHYQEATVYATALAKKLQEVDANSFANYQTLLQMTREMTLHNVLLDVNNKGQVDSFTALSNAVAMYTAGQNQSVQAHQEIRALLTGEVVPGAQLATQIDSMAKSSGLYKDGLKQIVAEGQKHGDTLERLAPFLVGINAASGDIATTWQAVTSSFETAVSILQRAFLKDMFPDIVKGGAAFVAWLKESEGAAETAGRVVRDLGDGLLALGRIAIVGAGLEALPAVFMATRTAVLSLRLEYEMLLLVAKTGGIQQFLTTPLWGVSVAAEAATGWLAKLRIATSLVFAAYAGWEIGTFWGKFESGAKTGVMIVHTLIKAWDYVSEAAERAYVVIKNPILTKSALAEIDAISKKYADLARVRDTALDMSMAAAEKPTAATNESAGIHVPKLPPGPDLTHKLTEAEKDAARLADQWKSTKRDLEQEINMSSLTGLDQKLQEVTNKAVEYHIQFDSQPGAQSKIDTWQAEMENAAIQADYLDRQKKATDELKKITDSYNDAVLASLPEEQQAVAKVGKEYDILRQSVIDMWAAHGIDEEEMRKRLTLLDSRQLEQETEALDKLKDKNDELSQFQIQAFRNVQDAGASMFESLRTGSNGFLSSFKEMTLKMVDQWAAAKAMMGMFGEDFGKGGALGGLLGTAATAIGGMFGSSYTPLPESGAVMSDSRFFDSITPSGGFDFKFADGGWIPEPVVGVGTRSGKSYSFAENESELILNQSQVRSASTSRATTTSVAQSSSAAPINVTIIAADAQSFADMTKRNPQAILGPLREALQRGDRGLRSDLQRVM